MIRLLADEDFDNRILRGVKARLPQLDFVRAQDVGLSAVPDPEVLAYAAETARVVISHDESTMGVAAANRIESGQYMPGVILIPQKTQIGRAIAALVFAAECSRDDEWNNRIEYLPL